MSTIDRASIVYRKRRESDQEFLLRLYASTRQDEMKVVPWSDEEKEQFLRMQFRAQTVYYDEHYDGDEFFIIERDGHPIGRLYLDQQPEDLRIVDIALLPEVRGLGLGAILLQEILERARSSNLPVTIHVEHFNPAMRLYERLGFRHVDTNGVYHLMRWEAA
jgi:ribosomal protein S18 acetylase RimI-like enzyme